MIKEIVIFRTTEGWVADFAQSSYRKQVLNLFGTAQLPTTYTEKATATEVVSGLAGMGKWDDPIRVADYCK